MYDPMPVFVPAPPAGYPVKWRNKDTGLEVRITLAELPPGTHFEWDSADYEDVVLVAQPDVESVSATWVAVAQGHGTPFVGPEMAIAVDTVPIADAVSEILEHLDTD